MQSAIGASFPLSADQLVREGGSDRTREKEKEEEEEKEEERWQHAT